MGTKRHKWICGKGSSGDVFIASIGIASLVLSGCASFSAPSSGSVDYQKQVLVLKQKLRRKETQIQTLKDQNMVLQRRSTVKRTQQTKTLSGSAPSRLPDSFKDQTDGAVPTPMEPVIGMIDASAASATPNAPQTTSPAPVSPNAAAAPQQAGSTPEQHLYSKILSLHRKRELAEMTVAVQLFLKTYPDSIFADNAIYAAGQLAFERGDHAQALKHMDRLLKEYPRSNKAVSAMFAKAAIESRQAKRTSAIRNFKKILEQFPGSPESARAAVELKLLDASSKKSRESQSETL